MSFLWILIGMSAFCCAFGFYCATKNSREEQEQMPWKDGPSVAAECRALPGLKQVSWIEAADFEQLLTTESDILLFRIRPKAGSPTRNVYLSGELNVTLSELEETLAWTPAGSKVVLYASSGVDPAVKRKLSKMKFPREVFAIVDSLPSDELRLMETGGRKCK